MNAILSPISSQLSYLDSLRPSHTLNTTLLSSITPTALHPPFYHLARPSILPFLSDKYLSLAAPVVVYWLVSLVFHVLDTAKFPYFEKRRIHESPEVLARNKATVGQVFRAVILQHAIQTGLALLWFEDDAKILRREVYRDHLADMAQLAPRVADAAILLLGRRSGEQLLRNHGEALVRWLFWWGIPAFQLFFAFFVMDTWQYWWHRTFHTYTYLYRKIHSVHHRLYVPYAFGALYNHPLEGIILDTLGAAVAHEASRMTMRQAIVLFAFASAKTVDDHCGYRIWWDPCQAFFYNNSDYHDIHHQAYGIKANFSQPFFTNWDVLLGTRMTREEANLKTRRVKAE